MLSDPESKTIRAFGVLNDNVPLSHPMYGFSYPGTFIVDREGVVRSKYFETQGLQDRYSAPTILLQEGGSVSGTRQTVVSTDHLELKYYSTQDVVVPQLRFTLVADFTLKPQMHVYAPGVQHYIPIRLELDSSPHYTLQPMVYPKPETLYLAPIQETVAVYKDKFRISQEVTMAGTEALQPILNSTREVTISGLLHYQACDDKMCYLPQSVRMEWLLKAEPLDWERPPEQIQHNLNITQQ